MSEWREKLKLNDGDQVNFVSSKSTGFMAETDVDTYDVLNAAGQKIGSVVVEDHTAVKGFKRTLTVRQRDASGSLIVEESWHPARG